MATYRQVHISFWQDGFVLGLTPEEKYFYLYLMTNSKTTQCGIYELPQRVIEMETGYNRETVDKLIDRFKKYRKIIYNDSTQEIMIVNWMKHNAIKSKAVMTCIAKELENVKHKPFISVFMKNCKVIKYPIETVYRPSTYGIESLSGDSGEEKEEEEEEEKEKEEEAKMTPSSLPSDNPHKDYILSQINKYQIDCSNLYNLELIFSYIGVIDIEVIDAAILKSAKKSVNYLYKTIQGMAMEGITKKEHLPQPKVGEMSAKENAIQPGRTQSKGRSLSIPDEEMDELFRIHREMPEMQ